MELLAPAGGPEQLRMAVHFGADAVYLAARRWGMRNSTPSICTSGRNGTMTSLPSSPNLDSISPMKVLSTAASLSSMFILKPRLSDWMMAPPRILRKLPKASCPSNSSEKTSTSRSPAEVMMDLA